MTFMTSKDEEVERLDVDDRIYRRPSEIVEARLKKLGVENSPWIPSHVRDTRSKDSRKN
jgi:hypothetical protein